MAAAKNAAAAERAAARRLHAIDHKNAIRQALTRNEITKVS